ncbi:MAG: hypothetical protein RL308_3054 [Bacteroidota bacterium]|jgi:uncharacterized protein (DUF2062 family)
MDIIALKTKTIALFKQGLTPIELTQSIIVSGLISTIPILGVSTFLLTALSLKRKLNLPIMIAQSYIMWPIQVIMIIPFINIGEFIFSVPKTNHSAQEIIASFQNSFFATLSHLSFELLCGFGGWLFTAVPFSIVFYLVSIFILKLFLKAKNQD